MSTNTPRPNQLKPAIISTADLSCYLIGAEDAQGQFHNIYSQDSSCPLMVKSLHQAKDFLREKGVEKVTLKLHTPYDEMIGMQTCESTSMEILL